MWSLKLRRRGRERFAPRTAEIQVERFEVNLGRDAIIKFLNEDTRGVMVWTTR